MARAVLTFATQDTSGNALTANTSVYVYRRGTAVVNGSSYSGTPITQTLYAASTGAATLANPLVPNSRGEVLAFTNDEVQVDLVTVRTGVNPVLDKAMFEYDAPDDRRNRVIRATQAPHNVKADTLKATTATTTANSRTVVASGAGFTSSHVGLPVVIEGGPAVRETSSTSFTDGSPTVTASLSFTGDDIGRQVIVNGGGPGGNPLVATVIAVPTSSTMILDQNCSVQLADHPATYPDAVGMWVSIYPPVHGTTIASVDASNQITLADADPISRTGASVTWGSIDTTSLSSAFATAALENRLLELPAGIIYVDAAITFGSNLHIRGAGKDLTIIKRAPAFTGLDDDGTLFSLFTAAMLISDGAVSNVTFEDLTLDNTHSVLDNLTDTNGHDANRRAPLCFLPGSENTTLRRVRVINCRCNVLWDAGRYSGMSGMHTNVTVEDCEFIDDLVTDGNVMRVAIYNPINCRVSNCRFQGESGLIAYSYAATDNVRQVTFERNTFKDCKSSNMLLRINGDGAPTGFADTEDIQFINNLFWDAGKTIADHKGFIIFGEREGANTVIPTVRRSLIHGNTGRGWQGLAFSIGNGTVIDGVVVSDNNLYGRDSEGTLYPSCTGISLRGSQDGSVNNYRVVNNLVYECGRSGIGVAGGTGGVIANNTLYRAAQSTVGGDGAADPNWTGAISIGVGTAVSSSTTDLVIANNVIVEPGSNTTDVGLGVRERAGIGFQNSSAITDVLITGNRISDGRAGKFLSYGVLVGGTASTPTDMPRRITIRGNNFTDALYAGVWAARPDSSAIQTEVYAYDNVDPGINAFKVIGGDEATVTGTTNPTTLWSKTLPADTLHAIGKLHIEALGTFAEVGTGNKTVRLVVTDTPGGATIITTLTAAAGNTNSWRLEADIWPIAAGQQRSQVLAVHGTTIDQQGYALLTKDMTHADGITISVQGVLATSTDSIVGKLFLVRPEAPY